MPRREIFLTILGVLLLLPGACGLYVAGAGVVDHIARATFRLSDYEEIFWLIAQPSVMVGCLGLFVLTKATKREGIYRVTKIAGWAALIGTIGATLFIGYAGYLRLGSFDSETVMFAGWFGLAFLIGGLPALLVGRPQPATD